MGYSVDWEDGSRWEEEEEKRREEQEREGMGVLVLCSV